MHTARLVVLSSLTGAALVLTSPVGVSAHVHAVTPLRCTPAPVNAGANQTNDTPAAAVDGGPIAGVIPVVRSETVPLFGGGFDAAACTS